MSLENTPLDNLTPEQVLLYYVLERAYKDLDSDIYKHRRTAILFFKGRTPCLPYGISYMDVVSNLELPDYVFKKIAIKMAQHP